MYQTSARFAETIVGTHRLAVRVQLLSSVQFGASPVGGQVLPLLSGDVRLSAGGDIKGTLQATVPPEYWDLLKPYGCEIFAERGVSFGDGSTEYVPLGYYRVERIGQQDSPAGPITVEASDRTAQLQQTRVIYPYQVPAGTSHRTIMEYLVNGVESGVGTYGMYLRNPVVPIVWDDAGYDPDDIEVTGDVVVDDSVYDFLAKLVDSQGATLRFTPTGELSVVAREPAQDDPVYAIKPGVGGTLVRASRSITRSGVYNMVRAVGSDPAHQTGYRLAYIENQDHLLRWYGPFGPAVRYYASPLLRTSEQAALAAQTVLARSTGLPEESSLFAVPDPRLQPLDVITSLVGGVLRTHVIDEVTVPLVGEASLSIKTRTVNSVPAEELPTDPDPEEPDPEEPDPDPDPDPGPDPTDGTQAAVLNNWGAVIDGDEFAYTGAPNPAKWGVYNGPGHVGNGFRRPSAFSVHDGIMTITGDSGGTTGGAAFKRGSMGYRVECRVRAYSTGSGARPYHPVLILWPDSDDWPAGAEYDFWETDNDSGVAALFMHLPNHQPYRQDHYSEPLDIQNYHNYACEWNPTARTLRAWFDGRLVYNRSGRVADAPGPMHLTVQLDNFGGPNRPGKMDVAWVRIYQRPNA